MRETQQEKQHREELEKRRRIQARVDRKAAKSERDKKYQQAFGRKKPWMNGHEGFGDIERMRKK